MKEWGRMIPTYRAGMKRCPVCGHRDNCSTWEYRRGAIFCRRVRSEHPGNGGWTHIIDEEATRPVLHLVKPEPKAAPVDRGKRDMVYQVLLRSLPLLTPHNEDLEARGLDALARVRGKFKSTPTEEEAAHFVSKIIAECDLSDVPGFYKDHTGWRMVKTPSGYFVPVLDRDGLIQGLQIRRDVLRHPKDPRYLWLSSSNYPSGTSSGAPAHIQNPERMATGKCIITEGALKSFVAAQHLPPDEGGIIGLAGVSCFRDDFALHLKQAFPSLHSVAIAFDRDWQSKKEVKRQLHRLLRVLKSQEFNVSICTWDTPEKGLDDFLVAESCEVVEAVA